MIPLSAYLTVSLALFGIGILGVLLRRNVIVIFMSIELILNAANLNLLAFSRYLPDVTGQIFAVFVIVVAAGEVAIGLAIVLALYRNRDTVYVDEASMMRW